ncbi:MULTISPECIES: hypothetical protein [Rhodococcus]|uniref:hypothetical protein n=1 Tax=Rhodococcus TaxID=1827 RepID=UPI00135A3613|nr:MULTISPECIES: hypothetical protein [Rhodococcus]UOT08351.1 hypothetical protein MPY17_39340 [Rhodococcus opacus]
MLEDAKQTLPALVLALFGLLIAAVVTLVLYSQGMTDGKDLTAVTALFTGITGTLVGTLLGAHIGAAGKMKLQAERDSAVTMMEGVMARHPDEDPRKKAEG